MRLLADECCHAAVVAALRQQGHDIRYIVETDPGLPDTEIIAIAAAEDRVLITEDFGFGELAVRRRRALPGLVILYFGKESSATRAQRLSDVIRASGETLRGTLTIVDARRIRRRSLFL